MSKYLGLFISEATEHLEALGKDLVVLEKEAKGEVVDALFRHAHSVKGMAASMGFEPIAVLAHRVEDVVDVLRRDLALVSRERVDLLLNAVDVMHSQVRGLAQGQAPGAEAGVAVLAALSEAVERLTGKAPTKTKMAQASVQGITGTEAPKEASAPKPPSEAGLGLPPRFSVKLRVSPSCRVPGVRAFLVHKRLSSLGNIFNLRPALEDLRAGKLPDGRISLDLETSSAEAAIREAIAGISEIELSSLEPVAPKEPAAAARPSPSAQGEPQGSGPLRTVRVRTEVLDYFLDTVGEMLLATARLREMGRSLPEAHRSPLEEGVYRLHTLVKDLHAKVMSARMTPFSVITDRLPRAARDIARRREREVELIIEGAEIELDRAILDDLADPLLHMLRNGIDHGIESPDERQAAGKSPKGRVQVNIKRARDRVVVEMEDDGRGMDAQKLRSVAVARGLLTAEAAQHLSDKDAFMLACLPGISTAQDVSEISGRGVGMDAVKRVVEQVGGTLEIESELGRGTRFTLRLPLTIAMVHLLLVGVGDEVFGLPITKVLAAIEAPSSALSKSREMPMLAHGSGLVPVHWLGDLLALPHAPKRETHPYVVVEVDGSSVALAVDSLMGQEEVVLKALTRPLDLISGLAGATILGTGRPIFILDVPRLVSP
jgi:two-component system chemotaxis sensor kinase CheA